MVKYFQRKLPQWWLFCSVAYCYPETVWKNNPDAVCSFLLACLTLWTKIKNRHFSEILFYLIMQLDKIRRISLYFASVHFHVKITYSFQIRGHSCGQNDRNFSIYAKKAENRRKNSLWWRVHISNYYIFLLLLIVLSCLINGENVFVKLHDNTDQNQNISCTKKFELQSWLYMYNKNNNNYNNIIIFTKFK